MLTLYFSQYWVEWNKHKSRNTPNIKNQTSNARKGFERTFHFSEKDGKL